MRGLIAAALFSVLALVMPLSASAQTATLTMLPDEFEVWDLSGDGRVVVGWITNATPRYACTWTREAGIQPIPKPAGWGATLARGVNHDGTVIAGEAATPEGTRAFIYKVETGMVALGVVPGASSSNATGISSNGRYVCGASGRYGFRYDAVTGTLERLQIESGEDAWAGLGVSDNGIVVGYANNFEGARTEPKEWPTPSVIRQLGPGLSNVYGEASNITPDGRWIVGTTDSPYLGQIFPPFPRLWDANRTPIGLIEPGTPFAIGASPTAASDDMRVIFAAYRVQGQTPRAAVWTPQSQMVRLWDVLQSEFGVTWPQGAPTMASKSSSDGRILVVEWWGPRSQDPRHRGIVEWTPPCEPDCTFDWELDIFDFLCFLNRYVEGDSYACAYQERAEAGFGSGQCDLSDFLVFQSRFARSCR